MNTVTTSAELVKSAQTLPAALRLGRPWPLDHMEGPLRHVAHFGEPLDEGLAVALGDRLGNVGSPTRVDLLEEPEVVERGHVVLGRGFIDAPQVLLVGGEEAGSQPPT